MINIIINNKNINYEIDPYLFVWPILRRPRIYQGM